MQILHECPRRHFVLQPLPTLDLTQGKFGIHLGMLAQEQGECGNVVVTMAFDEAFSGCAHTLYIIKRRHSGG